MISEPVVRSAQTVHLSCVKISTISKQTESSDHLSLITKEYHQVRPKRFLSLWYVRCKPFTYLASRLALYRMNWIKHPLELCQIGVLSGASKMISEPTVCLAQTIHLSCTDNNTISKLTKMRFHMTHVTLEFHRVRPKRFLRPWFIRHKPCSYLASRLALSLNNLNRASTWASSPRSTIGCV
jgi:gamma-glutamylcysteine synthetase